MIRPAAILAAALMACARPSDQLARVHDAVISAEMLAAAIRKERSSVSTEGARRRFEQMLEHEFLAERARRDGYLDRPEVIATAKREAVRLMLEERRGELATAAMHLSEAELAATYEEHRGDFVHPESMRVRAIVVADAGVARSIIGRLDRIRTERQFAWLAEQYSEHAPSRPRGGDLGHLTRDSKDHPREVIEAAFSLLRNGDLSAPIRTEHGHYVLYRTDRRGAAHETLEAVGRARLQKVWLEKRAASLREDLIRETRAEVDHEVDRHRLEEVLRDPRVTSRAAPLTRRD